MGHGFIPGADLCVGERGDQMWECKMSETLRLIIWGGGSACKNHYTMEEWWSLPNNCNKALQGGGKFTDFTVIYWMTYTVWNLI